MTLSWLQKESRRRVLRALLVVIIAASALVFSLPNLYAELYPMYGSFDFNYDSANNVVAWSGSVAKAAGVGVGDRIDFSSMPLNDRYDTGFGNSMVRLPRFGQTVAFVLERGGIAHIATVAASFRYHTGPLEWISVLQRAASLILIIVGSALFLIRPTTLSGGLFLYAIGWTHEGAPYFFSFLPGAWFAGLTVANDALGSAGTVGFLLIALNLGNNPLRARSALLRGMPVVVFVVLALLAALADVQEPFFGRPGNTYPEIGFAVSSFCYLLGIFVLLSSAIKRPAPLAVRTAAALLTTAAAASVLQSVADLNSIGHITDLSSMAVWLNHLPLPLQWIAEQLPVEPSIAVVSLFAALMVAYVVIRERVVDTGVVVSRTLAYGGTALAIVVVLALFNWAYASQLSAYPIAIPFEIIAAVIIGYWLTGVRDVSQSLTLAAIDAPTAMIEGRVSDAHDALTRALGFAERTRQNGLIAEIRARCAFRAWFMGEDELFGHHIGALNLALGSRSLRGLRAFAQSAALAEEEAIFDPSDLPEWKACALLLACGRSNDACIAQQCARDALVAATEANLPSLRIIALVALAELSANERDELLDQADDLARSNGWFALKRSLDALRSDARDIGMLQPFVDVHLRKKRPARATLEIAFFTGEVRVLGARVELPDKELELLLTVASTQSAIGGDELADALWPEADGDAARNALYACLHRLRKRLGDPRVIRRMGRGYALCPGAEVDLWRLQSALAECARGSAREHVEELSQLDAAIRAGREQRAVLGSWFYSFEQILSRRMDELENVLGTMTPAQAPFPATG